MNGAVTAISISTDYGTSSKAEQLAVNKAVGAAAENRVKEQLMAEGYEVLGSQVSVKTAKGIRRIDHLVKAPSGEIFAIEVKSGGAVRSASQVAKDFLMEIQGGTIFGKNAPRGFRGRTMKIITIIRH